MEARGYSNRLVRKLFFRLLPLQILSPFVNAINVFIDGLVTSRLLGTESMAAVGLFGTVSTVLGISSVAVMGTQLLCSTYLGKGDVKGVSSLFSACMVSLAAVGAAVGFLMFFYRYPLARFLGATGNAEQLLAEYIAGYAIGIAPQMLSTFFVAVLPLNDDSKLASVGIGVMVFSNLVLNFVFVYFLETGIIGLGLATSISYILSAGIMGTSFAGKDKLLRFTPRSMQFNKMGRALRMGMPQLMFNVGNSLKTYLLNILLVSVGGVAGVAAMSVLNSVCSLLGSFSFGCANAVGILAGIYYGEEDRVSMGMLTRFAMIFGSIMCAVISGLLMVSHNIIASIYYAPNSSEWLLTSRMLILFPCFLIFNVIMNALLKVYNCQGQLRFVNVLALAECLMIAAVAWAGSPLLGLDAVWLAFPVAEFLCIVVIGVSVFIKKKKVTFHLDDWLKTSDDFGAAEADRLDVTIESMEQMVGISRDVVGFCRDKGLEDKRCMVAGLAVEEMVSNTIILGFTDNRKHSVDVRVVYRDDTLTIRLRDDCKEYDPIKFSKQFIAEDPLANAGVRLIVKMAKHVYYINNIGMNVVLIKV